MESEMKAKAADPGLLGFTRRALQLSSVLAAVEGLAGFVYLLFIPADRHNSVFLGFSLQRLFILLFILSGVLVLAFLAFRLNRDKILLQALLKYIYLTDRVFISAMEAVEFVALFCSIIIFLFELKPPAALLALYDRALPLLVWLILICLQAIAVYSSIHYRRNVVQSVKLLAGDQWRRAGLRSAGQDPARSPSRWMTASLAVFLLLIIFPSANYQVFAGLPLDTGWALAALLLMAPLFFSNALLGRLEACLRRIDQRIIFILLGMLVLVLFAKVALLLSGTYQGFLACYASPVSKPEKGQCELSYTNPFFFRGITRIDPTLEFPNERWNLAFFNTGDFNLGPWDGKEAYTRGRIPFSAAWQAQVLTQSTQVIEVSYIGEGTIHIGKDYIQLPPSYLSENVFSFPAPDGVGPVSIQYFFDDGSRQAERHPMGLPASFLLNVRNADSSVHPLAPVSPPAGWLFLAGFSDLVVLIILVALVGFHLVVLGEDVWVLLAFALLGVVFNLALPELSFIALSAGAFVLLSMQKRPSRVLLAYFIFTCLAVCRVTVFLSAVDTTFYRAAGTDALTYESQAWAILNTWSLAGGEKVFYYQPFYRYFVFLYHMLFGDGDMIRATLSVSAINFEVFLLYDRLFLSRTAHLVKKTWPLLTSLALIGLMNSNVVFMMENGVSESLSCVLYPTIFLLLVGPLTNRRWIWITILIGLAFLNRTNHLPGLVFLFVVIGVSLFHSRPRLVLASGLLLLAFLALPALHNYVYGHKLVLLTSSADICLALPPDSLVHIFDNPKVAESFWIQLKYLVGLARVNYLDTSIPMWSLLLLWLGMGVKWIKTRIENKWLAGLLLLLPALFLGVQFFFSLYGSYPRHLISGYEVMGMVCLYVAGSKLPRGTPLVVPTDKGVL